MGALRAVAPAARTVLPTWFQRVPTASWGSLVHYWAAPHRQSIDTERTTAAMDICVVRGASGAHGAGASAGRSVRRLQPTSTWPQLPPMRFLSLTERNTGVPGPLDAVSMHFDTLFTFTPHPFRTHMMWRFHCRTGKPQHTQPGYQWCATPIEPNLTCPTRRHQFDAITTCTSTWRS